MNKTDQDYAKAIRYLRRSDDIMKQIIDGVGPCMMTIDSSPFRMLIRSIVGQQLSVAAAATIWSRFVSANGSKRVSPASIERLSDTDLRACGISHAKIRSIREIQSAFATRNVTAAKLRRLPDEDVKEILTTLRGVGPWTGDMFLMFGLGRMNVFPVGDLGIVNAIGSFYGDGSRPSVAFMTRVAEKWAPYRSIATWYCWQGLDLQRSGALEVERS